jgi:hypothetical protein
VTWESNVSWAGRSSSLRTTPGQMNRTEPNRATRLIGLFAVCLCRPVLPDRNKAGFTVDTTSHILSSQSLRVRTTIHNIIYCTFSSCTSLFHKLCKYLFLCS